MKMCKWCYVYETSYLGSASWRICDDSALDWLGIKKQDICGSCQADITGTVENLCAHFVRKFDGWKNGVVPKYSEIPKHIKIIGWVAWLERHLNERLNSRYFKKRLIKINV